VRFVGGCAVLMMRDGFVFAQFVFLIQSFGRSPATTQAEAAVELLPAAVTKQHQAHAMYTHLSMVWCHPQRTITESIFITCMEVFEIHVRAIIVSILHQSCRIPMRRTLLFQNNQFMSRITIPTVGIINLRVKIFPRVDAALTSMEVVQPSMIRHSSHAFSSKH
jgi:hypothetical protein